MRTPLNALRRRRCEAVIEGYPREQVAHAFDELRFRTFGPRALLEMLTDEAVEELAFRITANRRASNRMNARNRAIVAANKERATV